MVAIKVISSGRAPSPNICSSSTNQAQTRWAQVYRTATQQQPLTLSAQLQPNPCCWASQLASHWDLSAGHIPPHKGVRHRVTTSVIGVTSPPQVLREHLNCTLPIELVWHTPGEMDPTTLSALQELWGPITGVDLSSKQWPAHHRQLPAPASAPTATAREEQHSRNDEEDTLPAE
jgi:hypothetical protein